MRALLRTRENLPVLKEAKSADREARQSHLSTIFPDGRKSLGKFGTTRMVDENRGRSEIAYILAGLSLPFIV
jgi:hypothetical protein